MDSRLYLQLAQHYEHAIKTGTLLPGERMPSLRNLMHVHGVSLSTALQACRHMEKTGLLEARPRSGYFVCRPRKTKIAPATEPEIILPDPAQYVGIHERVSSVLARSQQYPCKVNLSGAFGAPELYPVEALKNAAIRVLRHQPMLFGTGPMPHGELSFRHALARHALSARINLSAEEILVTHGCTEALHIALRAVAGAGDVIAVESPTYYGLLQILESLGMRALEIPTSPSTGLSLEALELAAQTYNNIRAVVVVPNLQNPLGSIMPITHQQALVQWCEEHNIPLIEDDSYSLLSDAATPLIALKAWDNTGNVIHCASLHKSLAPGMRLGWLSGGRWHNRAQMLKYSLTRSNEALPQLAAAEFIASGAFERHLRRFRTQLRTQREQMSATIAATFPTGTRLSVAPGGINLWLELPQRLNAEAVFNEALRSGIRIMPGLVFSNSNRFNHFIRLNCGSPYTPEIDSALNTLATIVRMQLDP